MFFWVLFAALVCSQLSRIYHSTLVGLNDFTISETQIEEWISELDPSARTHDGGGGSGRGGSEVESEFDFWISADAATAELALSHLRNSVVAKAEADGWRITGRSLSGDESFHFSLAKGATRFRVDCWAFSVGKSSNEGRLAREGKNVFRVMLRQFGYLRG